MNKKIIAAFDFDGTLTDRDSLLLFFRYVCGKIKTNYALFKSIPILFMTSIGLTSRQEAKEALISHLFKGYSRKSLFQKGKLFAENDLNKIIRPEILQKLRWHQSQNHKCVLISANLNVYLEEWAKREGFDTVLCSKLAFDKEDNITGMLAGPNCWGPEKVRKLKEWLQEQAIYDYELYAYGDSRGDRDLLEIADVPVKV